MFSFLLSPYFIVICKKTVYRLAFNAVNAPITKTLANYVSLNIEYNNRYQITKHDWKLNGNTITGFNYGHDSVGNRLYSENLVTSNKSEHFAFDNADRLTSFKTGTLNYEKDNIVTPEYSQSWNLDSIGNWAGFTDNGTSSTNTFSDTHEMTQFKGVTNTFDNNGNLTSDGVHTFKFDAFNRIIQVKIGSVVLVNYQYDAFNRRVLKQVDADLNGSFELTVKFLYDGFRCIEELNASDALTKEYVYGSLYIDEVILQRTGATDYYFTHDYRYSVTSLTNTAGNIVESYDYKVYGQRTASGSGLTEVGYTGQRHDNETGLMYFKNRYYSVSMGQFVTRDPLGYVDGLSMYLGYFGGMDTDALGLDDNGSGKAGPDGGDGKNNNPIKGKGPSAEPGESANTEQDFKFARTQLVPGGIEALHPYDVDKISMPTESSQKKLRVVLVKGSDCKYTLAGTISIKMRIFLYHKTFTFGGNKNQYKIGSGSDQGLWAMLLAHEKLHYSQILTGFEKVKTNVDALKLLVEGESSLDKAKVVFNEGMKLVNKDWHETIANTYAHKGFPGPLATNVSDEDVFNLWQGIATPRGAFTQIIYNEKDKSQHLEWEVFKKEFDAPSEVIEKK